MLSELTMNKISAPSFVMSDLACNREKNIFVQSIVNIIFSYTFGISHLFQETNGHEHSMNCEISLVVC